jgi:DNA-directed RNA polymerase subunit M/transcription elongation factor TFIIS
MDYVELRSFDNYIEANIIMSMLQSQSIVCHLKDEHIITIDPFLSPAIGGMKLMVHHSQVDRAWDLMDQAEAQYLKSRSCPICKSHGLSIVSIKKKHSCRLAALANMVLRGQSLEITKMYRCNNCGYDFKELP